MIEIGTDHISGDEDDMRTASFSGPAVRAYAGAGLYELALILRSCHGSGGRLRNLPSTGSYGNTGRCTKKVTPIHRRTVLPEESVLNIH
jgi:hypothetical protein